MAKKVTAIDPVTNGGETDIGFTAPYSVKVSIEGTAALLFHRWNVEAVAEKAAAAKGSKSKKTDNVESYVYRLDSGEIALPGEYLRQAIIHAAKYKQDPRSPRKSAMDLFKAGVIMHTELMGLGAETWDYLDQRRVQVQRNGLTRTRPAMEKGWTTSCEIEIILPEYITKTLLHQVMIDAGRLVGVGDFRPTYGRFLVTKFE